MNVNEIVKNIKESITTKKLSKETENFLIHWLSDEDKTNDDREVFMKLARDRTLPFNGTNLFRGCKTLRDGNCQSYSMSIREAARFANNNGYIIAVDTSKTFFDTFDLSEYLYILLRYIVNGEEENIYSEELIDIYETRCGEDEILLVTDLDSSVVMKVDSIGENL